MNRRTFIFTLAAATSPRFLQKDSDPVAVLRTLGYRVEPYLMTQEEYNRVYRLPVGICNFICQRGHQRIFAGIPGNRKLRCLVCRSERLDLDLEGGNGIVLACGKWWKVS